MYQFLQLKYLTLSVGYSLLPYNLIFKLPSNFLCLDLKITITVFVTLTEILFAFNQFARCFKSVLTSLFSFLIELLKHKRLVSSAKWCTLQYFIAWLRSFIYSKIEEVLEQVLEGRHNLKEKTRFISSYGYILIGIRQIRFKPIIWNSTNPTVIQFC